ncbi:2-C-methyl-D-erythritol 4-phosphate cytidylyltransferase [Candidatus Fermentibacteria bacterium]|nr:2-C-methyl-D-erythritol 4-phosphate cytidylyltransferase [Candidatus Fermentibacteria bacterium]
MRGDRWAIVVAAGASSRMGGAVPKQFRLLGGMPLYRWSMRALHAWGGVTLVVPEDSVTMVRSECAELARIRVVAGGPLRRDSVARGLAAVPEEAATVLVHDAARPFLAASLIRRVADACEETGMALPVLPVADTVKRQEGHYAAGTVDRRGLMVAQTPQACRREVLAAIVAALPDRELTDEAQGAELLGIRPRLVPGSPFAFKLTTEGDFVLAEALAQWVVHTGSDHADWMWVRHTPAD